MATCTVLELAVMLQSMTLWCAFNDECCLYPGRIIVAWCAQTSSLCEGSCLRVREAWPQNVLPTSASKDDHAPPICASGSMVSRSGHIKHTILVSSLDPLSIDCVIHCAATVCVRVVVVNSPAVVHLHACPTMAHLMFIKMYKKNADIHLSTCCNALATHGCPPLVNWNLARYFGAQRAAWAHHQS